VSLTWSSDSKSGIGTRSCGSLRGGGLLTLIPKLLNSLTLIPRTLNSGTLILQRAPTGFHKHTTLRSPMVEMVHKVSVEVHTNTITTFVSHTSPHPSHQNCTSPVTTTRVAAQFQNFMYRRLSCTAQAQRQLTSGPVPWREDCRYENPGSGPRGGTSNSSTTSRGQTRFIAVRSAISVKFTRA
jgi:hypothetical protein